MRLIDADVLEAKLKKLMKKYARLARIEVAEDYNFVITVLSIAPTIDAVPVVHGRWINRTKNIRGLYDYRYDCSVCQHIFWYGGIETFNYCPNCGAKMDGERKEK